MGIFAMYTGFIYNDIFSLNLPVFASGWRWPSSIEPGQLVEAISTGRTYAFGLDPAWHGADNALIFTNSLKMKMSIIFGVCHVSPGNWNHPQSLANASDSLDVVRNLLASSEPPTLQE